MDSIEWPPEYRIRRSKRARRLILKLDSQKGIEVVIPYFVSHKEAHAFLASNRTWLESHPDWAAFCQRDKKCLPQSINFACLNKTWQLYYDERPQQQRIKLIEHESHIQLRGNLKDNEQQAFKTLRRWLKKQAAAYLPELLAELASLTGLDYQAVTIRSQKTLWGSCSQHNEISLNCKLLFFPVEIVRYVLIHELCHTVHFNHSERFWQLVARFVPNYHELRQQLKYLGQYLPEWA